MEVSAGEAVSDQRDRDLKTWEQKAEELKQRLARRIKIVNVVLVLIPLIFVVAVVLLMRIYLW